MSGCSNSCKVDQNNVNSKHLLMNSCVGTLNNSPYSWVSHLKSYSLNTRGCVPVHARNLAPKCHWIWSNLMEIPASIYLFLMSGINFSLELSDYWSFSMLRVVVRITTSLSYLLIFAVHRCTFIYSVHFCFSVRGKRTPQATRASHDLVLTSADVLTC